MAEDSNKQTSSRKPPAFSFTTLTNFLYQFQEGPVPSHIDRSVYPKSMSGQNQTYLQSSLKYLGLVTEQNVPEPVFSDLVKADQETRATIWRRILQTKYGFLLDAVDIERATSRIVIDKFKEQGISGDTIRKAITFFLHAAKEAGLTVSPHVKTPRPPQGQSRSQKEKTPGTKDSSTKNDSLPMSNEDERGGGTREVATEPPYQVLIKILSNNMTEQEQDAVWTLIRYLKKQEVYDEANAFGR